MIYSCLIGLSFPFSYKSLDSLDYNLKENYVYHLSFLGIVLLALIPTDINAFFNNVKIKSIISL
jgi:hypothetical protein